MNGGSLIQDKAPFQATAVLVLLHGNCQFCKHLLLQELNKTENGCASRTQFVEHASTHVTMVHHYVESKRLT